MLIVLGLALSLLFGLCASPASGQELPVWDFARRFSTSEILGSASCSKNFCRRWAVAESRFFAAARDPRSGLSFDGWDLDPITREPLRVRAFSAASKESLDLALLLKAVQGDPYICLVVDPDNPERARAKALNILDKKVEAYWRYYQEYPGFSGFFGWFYSGPKAVPMQGWQRSFPSLDLGEMLWALKLTEYVLSESKEPECQRLAARYAEYIALLTKNAKRALYSSELGGVRGIVKVGNPFSADTSYSGDQLVRGQHGVHEGQMVVLFLSLYGGLSASESDAAWDKIAMKRIEHPLGTTWQGFWGSPHEEWAYLFLPYRRLPEYKNLFRIREKIRSQNAVRRGYFGLAASAHHPLGKGYMSAAGIEGVASEPLEHQDTYTPYAAFPLLLEFSDKSCGNLGLAWFQHMLLGRQMLGPFGVGESGDNAGTGSAPIKTIDVSFVALLANSGGLAKEAAEMLHHDGKYEEFTHILLREYYEAFGEAPLREPLDFALPNGSRP